MILCAFVAQSEPIKFLCEFVYYSVYVLLDWNSCVECAAFVVNAHSGWANNVRYNVSTI